MKAFALRQLVADVSHDSQYCLFQSDSSADNKKARARPGVIDGRDQRCTIHGLHHAVDQTSGRRRSLLSASSPFLSMAVKPLGVSHYSDEILREAASTYIIIWPKTSACPKTTYIHSAQVTPRFHEPLGKVEWTKAAHPQPVRLSSKTSTGRLLGEREGKHHFTETLTCWIERD